MFSSHIKSHPMMIVSLMLFSLLITPSANAATPATFTWGSNGGGSAFGVLDSDNATILETADFAQFIWAGPDGTIDTPNTDGSPGDDDQLLATNTVQNTGTLPPPLRNQGLIPLLDYSFDTDHEQNGGLVYIRAWNASTLSDATHYGDSTTAILSDSGNLNATRWNTLVAFTPLAVTLASFEASPQQEHIQIRWQTVSELDNLGFNVYRSTTDTPPESPLNDELISSQAPGSGQGFPYSYQDHEIEAGVSYYYWLEDIDLNGVRTQHGPLTTSATIPTAVTLKTVETVEATPLLAPWLWALPALGLIMLLTLAILRRRYT